MQVANLFDFAIRFDWLAAWILSVFLMDFLLMCLTCTEIKREKGSFKPVCFTKKGFWHIAIVSLSSLFEFLTVGDDVVYMIRVWNFGL